ncbi:hypothetical protein F7725_027069 [Dissostichus mawsoni]|uniref:Uncharacterized protein n=1 Tax=Dissostichus mawsoni TaxID=36200 RepID=A0A7J5XC48_DISMA|nr:hypothetical protein F7725_027069 [Dissostichus mawsoni]
MKRDEALEHDEALKHEEALKHGVRLLDGLQDVLLGRLLSFPAQQELVQDEVLGDRPTSGFGSTVNSLSLSSIVLEDESLNVRSSFDADLEIIAKVDLLQLPVVHPNQ